MNSLSLDEIKRLFHRIILPFHEIERDITLPLASHRGDNDAEHSWSLAMLAISLAPLLDPELDIGKVSILACLHDLVEVNAGDTSFWADQKLTDSKREREALALKTMQQDFSQFSHIFTYIEEYEQCLSNEAQFVYALDKFLNMLMITEDNGYFHHKNKITKVMYDSRIEAHDAKAQKHPAVGRYYSELRTLFDNNPKHFYQQKS